MMAQIEEVIADSGSKAFLDYFVEEGAPLNLSNVVENVFRSQKVDFFLKLFRYFVRDSKKITLIRVEYGDSAVLKKADQGISIEDLSELDSYRNREKEQLKQAKTAEEKQAVKELYAYIYTTTLEAMVRM